MIPVYQGPVFDAHHHLWDCTSGARPWLDEPEMRDLRGSGHALAHRAVFGGAFAGTIWIEGLSCDPEAELAEAEALRLASNGRVNTGLVAHAPLDAPDIARRLDRLQAISPALRGIRDIVAHAPGTPSPARAPDLLDRPGFLNGLKELERRGLVFDLMLRPGQMEDVSHLLKSVPDLITVVEHCGSPNDQSEEGLRAWYRGIALLAAHPGCHMKVSALHCLVEDCSDRCLAMVLDPLYVAFGAERMAFGTDWPVHDRHCPGPESLAAVKRITARWPEPDQRHLVHDTARRV